MRTSSLSLPLWLLLAGLLIAFESQAQEPGSPKTLRPSDAVSDAAGTGQLFECIHVPNVTDFVQGLNGFALADLDGNGYLDIVTVTTPPFNLEGWPPRDSLCEEPVNFPLLPDSLARDKLRILLNRGGWVFEPVPITLLGSPATPEDFSQGLRGGQIPALADFNNDGLYDLFVGRQPSMMVQGQIPPDGPQPVGCSLLLAQDSLHRFVDVSQPMNALNALAYNRQVSLGDVNGDGWLDIAVGADNVAAAFEGLPQSALLVYQPDGAAFTDGHFQDIGGTELAPDFGGFYLDPARDKAGPNITLRDADNDGDLDLFQSTHILPAEAPAFLPHSPAEYRQGVWTWQNQLSEGGSFLLGKDTLNGMAQEARLDYDFSSQRLVRQNPLDSAIGLAYLAFGDVDNDGFLDALAFDASDRDRFPAPRDVGAVFWYNDGGFSWTEATAAAGLNSLNDTYLEWYSFFGEPVTPSLFFRPQPVTAQPGLEPPRFANRRAYHADATFADFNNDGWLDLVVLDRRQQEKVVKKRSKFYLNNGNGTFTPKTTAFSGIDASGISCEAADFNNDGLVDLLIAGDPDNSGMPCHAQEFEDKVYLNTGLHGAAENNWLRFRFAGVAHARLIGARVELFDPVDQSLLGMRGIYTDQTYKSSSVLEAHFGLGEQDCADLKVTLIDGAVFEAPCIAANQYLTVDFEQGELLTSTRAEQGVEPSAAFQVYPNPTADRVRLTREGRGVRVALVQVFNSSGQEIRQLRQTMEVDLTSLPAGCYYLRIQQGGRVQTLPVVKR